MEEQKKRIFFIGYMGSGKTTFGKAVAQAMNLEFIDLDVYIEHKYFKTISDIFAEYGENGFREIEKRMLHEVAQFENVLVACGGGTPCFFDNMSFMNENGTTLYLKSSPEFLTNTLRNARQNRPLLREKTEEELLQYIRLNLAKREPYYSQAQLIADCDADGNIVIARLLSILHS